MPFSPLARLRKTHTTLPVALPPTAASLLRNVKPAGAFDPLQKVVHLMRAQHVGVLPVTDGPLLIGWVRGTRLTDVLLSGEEDVRELVAGDLLEPIPLAMSTMAQAHEVLQAMQDTGETMLPVVSYDGAYQGMVEQAAVLGARAGWFAPPRMGGMATPLGVYLTTGVVSGGAGTTGLMLTGAVMAVMLFLVQALLALMLGGLYHLTQLPFFGLLALSILEKPIEASPVIALAVMLLSMALLMLGFFTCLRFMPRMAGFHAAEHQTVNAVEAGEPLTPEAVARMPRVHPRCGTNLWGLMTLAYLGVAVLAICLSTEIGRQNLTLVMAVVLWYGAIMALTWKRFGAWLQAHVTTRDATRAEIESGIRAAEELLQRHRACGGTVPTLRQRLWRMGLAQVLFGAILTGVVLQLFALPLDDLMRYLVK